MLVYTLPASAQSTKPAPITQGNNVPKQYTFAIIPAAQNTYGYKVNDHNKLLIHQLSIPGIPGNKGFTKKTDAEKCAKLVIHKIMNDVFPPTVSRRELDSLNITL